MKRLSIISLITIITFIGGGIFLSSCGTNTATNEDSSEMHEAEDHSAHDAETESVEGEDGDAVATTHACPMHPEITGLEGDKCSKCGMDLTLAEASEEEGHGHQH